MYIYRLLITAYLWTCWLLGGGGWAALYLHLYYVLFTRGPGFVLKTPRAQCVLEVGTFGELRRTLQPSQDPVLWT